MLDQLRFERVASLFLAAAALFLAPRGNAQSSQPVLIGADYTFLRTNILPGCNCVGLNGGGAQLQYGLSPHLAALADFTATHRSGITPDGYSLTQLTYTFGMRYFPAKAGARLQPFADTAFGGAHALGSLAPSSTGVGSSSNAFAMQAGGGLQVPLGSYWTFQPVRAEYVLTTFGNAAANRQNDLRLSAGLLIRLGRLAAGERR